MAASRELHEEADLVAEQWHVLADYFSSPGGMDEALRVYLARGLSHVPEHDRHDREGELGMPVRWVDLDEAQEAVLTGRVHNPSAVVGILAAHAARARGWATLRAHDALAGAPGPPRAVVPGVGYTEVLRTAPLAAASPPPPTRPTAPARSAPSMGAVVPGGRCRDAGEQDGPAHELDRRRHLVQQPPGRGHPDDRDQHRERHDRARGVAGEQPVPQAVAEQRGEVGREHGAPDGSGVGVGNRRDDGVLALDRPRQGEQGTGTMVPDHTTIASPEPAWPRAPTRRAMTLPTAHELAAATTSSTGTTGACAARPTPTVARPAAPTRTPASWPRVGCSRSARLANTSVKRTWDCSTRGVRPAGMPACIARYTSPN